MKKTTFLSLLCLMMFFMLPVFADDPKPDQSKPEFKVEFPKEVLSETKHSVEINGKTISYTATAGNILLKQEDGRPKASIFFIAYIKDGTTDFTKRPMTYSFNGGPGSSSVWLHLGAFGPQKVHIKDDGTAYPPPYSLENNGDSIFDLTDIVFIDPVSTGFSRAVPGEEAKQYHGVEPDVESVGEFIRLFTNRFKRWDSPKYLAGESYGTTRASALVRYMQDRHGMYFNGVILVSTALDFATLEFGAGNDLPYILYVPGYTAAAWYHKKLPADLQQGTLKAAVDQSRAFAMNEYGPALLKGDQLSDSDRKNIVEKLSRFTGISATYIEQSNLRIADYRFFKELMRDQRLTIGRLDSRFLGRDVDAAGETNEYDPSYATIQGVFTATFNDYVRRDLKYENDGVYEILSRQIQDWDQGRQKNRYLNVSEQLREAMTQNPDLRIFVANGYYDLACPFSAGEYVFNHLGLDPDYKKRVTMGYYEGGHMMYINKTSLDQLKSDLTKFYGQ